MEALIPKLFILTAEASIVLFLLLIIIIFFNSRAKRKDIKAVNEMVKEYISNKAERLSTLKNQLQSIGFSDNKDTQAEQLYEQEKSLIKEFVSLYLQHDTERLLDYADHIIAVDTLFLNTTGTAEAVAPLQPAFDSSEEKPNAAILAGEQQESNEGHLKELSELRLKNTELNEHLFEALETITALMTEHGKKTGQEVDCNAQKVLQAIIYLRDQRLGKGGEPIDLAPTAAEQDKIEASLAAALVESDAALDATLDDSTVIDLGLGDNLSLGDELDVDLDELDNENVVNKAEAVDNTLETELDSNTIDLDKASEDDDPWTDALAEQASAEAEADPWADALAEQAMAEESTSEEEEEEDPWAEALAEQATAEAAAIEEEDPWAAALAEQEKSENK